MIRGADLDGDGQISYDGVYSCNPTKNDEFTMIIHLEYLQMMLSK